MKYSRTFLIFIVVYITLSFPGYAFAYDRKPIILNPDYKHDRFNTQPKEIARFFRAYTASFAVQMTMTMMALLTIWVVSLDCSQRERPISKF